jgi:hypothetical protein
MASEVFVSMDVEYNVPYVCLSATCPYCESLVEFEAIESYMSPLKTISLCEHAFSQGFKNSERVVLFKQSHGNLD